MTATLTPKKSRISELRAAGASLIGSQVTLKGWIRTARKQKTFVFLEVNDGSSLGNIQVIVDDMSLADSLDAGAAVVVTGEVVESPGKGQAIEIKAESIQVVGSCDPESYPLQKKRHSFEFLRSIAHLRPRTNALGAVTRIRNTLSFAIHDFFQQNGFLYINTPIITGSDCEGAGELFEVTTGAKEPFFGRKTFLTVSGQLEAEIYALSHSDVYTFGPTFRAENSNTSRHLAEFWMIEPEIAFCDLSGDMDNAEACIKYVVGQVLEKNSEDLELFDKFISKGILDRLRALHSAEFARCTYTEAIKILESCGRKFEYPVAWGVDLQSEHERFLAEEHFKGPVFLTDYPKTIKAFYMRSNDDGKTVAAMDLLVPGIGELIGGSQREERYDVLLDKIKEAKIPEEEMWWYLELRKYGSCPHAGYGIGFERLVQYVTGMENIREVIPFPRSPGHAEF